MGTWSKQQLQEVRCAHFVIIRNKEASPWFPITIKSIRSLEEKWNIYLLTPLVTISSFTLPTASKDAQIYVWSAEGQRNEKSVSIVPLQQLKVDKTKINKLFK